MRRRQLSNFRSCSESNDMIGRSKTEQEHHRSKDADWILSDVAGQLGLDGAHDMPEWKFESEEAELDSI